MSSRRDTDDIVQEILGNPQIGPVERSVRKYIESIEDDSTLGNTYAEIAYNLARKLDRGAGMATAAVGRELRELITMIAESNNHELTDLFKKFGSTMPAKMGNSKRSN
jgi:hypothetical protein